MTLGARIRPYSYMYCTLSRDGALQVYRVSALDRDLLMKNIGLCFKFSSSLNKASLTKTSETAR